MADIRTTGAGNGARSVFIRDELAGLPAPVVRYFEFALTPGQALVRGARFRQTGSFAMRPGSWRPFTAVEHFSVHPPTFLWDARIRLAPLVSVRVRDGYRDGVGTTRAKVAGLITVADLHGSAEITSGALVRYLAEAVWLPTALLPSEGIQWDAIDDATARATLSDRGTTVSLDVHVDERGAIASASTVRYRAVDHTFMRTPWICHYRDYTRVEGMMVPMTGEVQWVLPEGRLPYWRGRTIRAEYDFAPMSRDTNE